MKCAYCGTVQAVEQDAERQVRENPLENIDTSRFIRLSEEALEISCSSCGAVIQFEPPEVAGICPFCAGKIVAQPKAADPLIAPEAVLPFSIPGDRAAGAVRQWLGSRWFAPSGLAALARHDSIAGVYLPFWTFDAETATRYEGQRGDAYYETERYTERDSQGRVVQRERQVRKIRWGYASGVVRNSFDDILIPASRSVLPKRLDALEPWDLPSLRPYEPAFLAGFKAQRYQVELPDGFRAAKERMAGPIEDSVRDDIGGDEQQIHALETDYSDIHFKHLLLPVWIGAYRFHDKVYQVVVNARTGEVQGERPWSAAKIFLFIVAFLLVLLILVLLRR